jgi:hypothetical protein
MREKLYKFTFFGTAFAATVGWVWVLYRSVSWIVGSI